MMDKRIKVGLVQIGDSFGGQHYLPYSVGLLQAYAKRNLKNPDAFDFKIPIYKRVKADEALNYLIDAGVIFFSAYVWNYRISLEIARTLKQFKDTCVIAFGGPQVPESKEGMKEFLENNPFVDIGCYGEGETTVLKILENLNSRLWDSVPSAGFIAKGGKFNYNRAGERIEDINKIPSPYLEGIFDLLIQANPNESWSALVETNRGCPYMCAYCYWGIRARSKVCKYDMERIFKEIDWISRHKISFVFCCDANFGIFERDADIAAKVAENKKEYGYPEFFSVQNTKNSTEMIFSLQKILNDAGLQKGVNLALQSMDKNTLKNIHRDNISIEMYKDLAEKFSQAKISTFSDIIISLPGESYNTFTQGVSRLIESGQHNRIQFINLALLVNTKMAEPQYQKKYGLVIKEIKAISHHTSLYDEIGPHETQDIVVGTSVMSGDEWVRTRVFCWAASLFYFDKLLQVVFMLLNKLCSAGFKDLIEVFISASKRRYSEIAEISAFFINKARDIQNGGSEYIASKEWLNIWWPADEYMFIKLCREDALKNFYDQTEAILKDFIKEKKLEFSEELLHEAVQFNKDLVKLPFKDTDLDILLHYNIPEIYEGGLKGKDVYLEEGQYLYKIDRTSSNWPGWNDWMREVVWYGTKKGAYLYSVNRFKNDPLCLT